MSEDTAKTTDPVAETQASEEPTIKPIGIDLDDLTEEAKERAEKQIGRKIPDMAYTIHDEVPQPHSALALTCELTRSVYDDELNLLLRELAKDITLPGFRKGKAPAHLLRIRLGDEAVRDTIASMAMNVLRQETARREWKLVGRPQIVDYTVEKRGDAPVSFKVEVEMEPEVELKQYKDFKVEVEKQVIDEQQIEDEIDQMRRRSALDEPAPEGAVVNPDDRLAVDVVATDADGKRLPHLSEDDRMVWDLERDLPEGLGKAIIGKKVGEVATGVVENKTTNRRGEEIVHKDRYTVTVKEITRSTLPDLDDEFAKDMGDYESLADLKKSVRERMEEGLAERQRSAALSAIMAEVLKANPVDPPRSFVARQQHELIMQDNYQMARMGLRLEDMISDVDGYMASRENASEDQVKMALLRAKIVEAENIEITDDDIKAEIEKMAEQAGRRPEAIQAKLEADQQIDGLRDRVRGRKFEDFLLAHNTVKETTPKAEKTDDDTPKPSKPKKKTAAKSAQPKKKTAQPKKTTAKEKKDA